MMDKKQRIACTYYPSTVIMVDDNGKFLKNIADVLKTIDARVLTKIYVDPQSALDDIKNATQNNDLLNSIVTNNNSQDYLPSSGQLPLQLDISNLYKHAYNKQSLEEVSVVVVDYTMPDVNGEDFCKHLINNPVKKIMLTGDANTELAVQLFNDGIIDQFFQKGKPDLEEKLVEGIIEMQKRYFQDLTSPLIHSLSADKESALGDPAFLELFEKTCHATSASSYYLIEPSGSYLLIDDVGVPAWLIIKTQDEINDYIELMEDANISPEIIESVKRGERMPYFVNSDDYMHSIDKDVEKYLYPAKQLIGKKTYSYFLTKNLPDFLLNRDLIIPFKTQSKCFGQPVV